ncbi:MAG: Hsp70 family protein, partial [Coriobacteriales bacterium]
MERILGIDLGTTNSAMAALDGGSPYIIENAQGERVTPSVVSFTTETESIVGSRAAQRAGDFPTLTVSSIKRFIGTRYDECELERTSAPYVTAHARDGGVCVKIKTHERTPDEIQARVEKMVAERGARLGMDYLIDDIDGTEYSPEQISALILGKLKEDAKEHTGFDFADAVITVPANFNDAQRQATRRAGELAGFNVRRIISEPTAAALAYGAGSPDKDENVLIFDLGGGTFDVSLLQIQKGVFRVIATHGDNHLGGDDWDRTLMKHLADAYQSERGRELADDAESLQALKEAADAVKIALSGAEKATAKLAADAGEQPLEVTVTRQQFEDMTSSLRARLTLSLEAILRDAREKDVLPTRAVLVGGSTRIPSVRQVVERVTGLAPDTSVNPDEAVALGAAIQGGLLSGEIQGIELIDVTPLSLGVETKGGFTQTIIKRHTPIPTQAALTFMTTEDDQERVSVNVLQGERTMAADNKSLGTFTLDGLPPAPAGRVKVEIIFDIDANGIVTVVAREPISGTERQLC